MAIIDKEVLDAAISFHGHVCPGLLIGVRSALIARRILERERSSDEELFAIVENRACGVDALQVLLGTTAGKGNLFFEDSGKQVVVVGCRASGKAIRIAFKRSGDLTRGEKMERLMNAPDEELFEITDAVIPIPPKAKVFRSVACDRCGEGTMETALRLLEGQKLCKTCFKGAL